MQQDIFPWRPAARWPHTDYRFIHLVLTAAGHFSVKPSCQVTTHWLPYYSSDSSRTPFTWRRQAPSDRTAHSLGTIVLTAAGHLSTKTSRHVTTHSLPYFNSDSSRTFLSEGQAPSIATLHTHCRYYSSDCSRTFFHEDQPSGDHTLTIIL
jgi:hypothetical protein